MDYWGFRLINDLAGRTAWLDRVLVLVAQYGPLLFAAALAWLWVAQREGPQRDRDRLAAGRALAAAALALAAGQVITWVYPRPRPFMTHPVRLLIPPSTDPSFPSDHALAAFAIAGALAWSHRRLGVGLVLLGGLLSFARVFVGTHYPLDVLTGAVIGWAVGGLIRKADAWVRPLVALGGRWTDAVLERVTTAGRPK